MLVLNAVYLGLMTPKPRRGATLLGGDTVTDPDTLLDTIAEGGSGYHFWGKSVEKIIARS